MKKGRLRAARGFWLAVCILGLAAIGAGWAVKGVSYVMAQKLQSSDTADGGESEPIATDDADLRFRERFYALSPDSLEVTDAETAEKAASEGREGLGILLAEFPQEDISVYGYVDAEKPWQGVMIRCGDNVSYFPDIVYLSESREMPEIYADSSNSLIIASFHAGAGEEKKRDTLYAFLKSPAGTMTCQEFTAEDFLGQMENRFSLSYQPGENSGKLVGQDGRLIGEVDLSWADGAAVTGLNVINRVRFIPGSTVWAEVEIGITAEGRAPYYGENLVVTAPVELNSQSYGNGTKKVSFLIGEVREKAGENQSGEGLEE